MKLDSGGPTTSRVNPEVVPEAAVVGAFVSADGVKKLVFGPATVFPFVGKENCSATHSEEAVGDKHGTLIAIVPVQGDIFRAHNYGIGAPAHLHVIYSRIIPFGRPFCFWSRGSDQANYETIEEI